MAEYVDEESLKAHVDNLIQLRPGTHFPREYFDEIEPHPLEWLVKHFLPTLGIAIIYGASTVGKSFLILYVCMRICRGNTILGHRSVKRGVLYVAAEGQNGMRKRIKAIRQQFNVSTKLFQFIGKAPNLLNEADVEGLTAAALAASAEMLAAEGVPLGLVVIDTTAASMAGGNENAGEDMTRVLAAGEAIGRRTGALVMYIAHPGKNEALGVRGWSGQGANVDAVIYLTKSEEDPALRIGVVQKLKDGEDGERFAYRLKQISMGTDADGDAITSAYPVFEQAPNAGSPRRRRSVEEKPGPALIMRAIRQLIEVGQPGQTEIVPLVPPVPGVRPGTVCVRRGTLRAKAIEVGYADPDEKPESVKRMFNRDLATLTAKQVVRVHEDLVWPVR
jgi:hypothetical protein